MQRKPTNKHSRVIKSYLQIKEAWENIQSQEIKKRYKTMREIAYDICYAYKAKDVEPVQLEFYMHVLKEINTIQAIPKSKIALAKITALWLEFTGNANVKIIKKILGKITIETSTIAVGDIFNSKEVLETYANYTEQSVLTLINQAKLFIFGTGGDGEYTLQIRIVDSIEPVLSANEYKNILNSTEKFVININTGVLVVADPCYMDAEKQRLSINVDAGNYKVCVYHYSVRSKADSFYIVLCKTNEEAKNAAKNLPQFD